MHHNASMWFSCRLHWKWSFLEQVSGNHFISATCKLATEADFCCITKHGLLEFPTGIYCSELTAWKKRSFSHWYAEWHHNVTVRCQWPLLGVKMLFPGSSHKCLGDLQMEPQGLTNSKQQNRSSGESQLQTVHFLNKEI